MKKPTAGIVCGGFTSEYEISIKSGQTVFENVPRDEWNLYLIVIRPDQWWAYDAENNKYPISIGDLSILKGKEKIPLDVVFNAVHGAPGEDGQLAALFQLLKIPHTSCDSYTAGLTYNKRDCLTLLGKNDIPMAKSYYFDAGDPIDEMAIIDTVGLPCFVKANRAGSSFGVSKVSTQNELTPAIEKALKEDSQIIIETALDGREVSVGVIAWEGTVKVLPITEIVTENAFFDYAAKYEGKAAEITPAQLPPEMETAVNVLAKKIFIQLGINGMGRSEFIFVDGVPHFLEINTIPGLTAQSIIPQQLQEAGIPLDVFFNTLLKNALNKKN